MTRRFVFVGVTTGQSSIMHIFPRWRDRLGLGADVEIVGYDLPIDAGPDRYRRTVQELRGDPDVVGALVTTHKMNLYHAAADLFASVDEYAEMLGEVSCISKRGGRLLGRATDPISAGRTLMDMLGPLYFDSTGANVLCFGAGGAGQAIVLTLLERTDEAGRPGRVTVTDTRQERLDALHALHARMHSALRLECVLNTNPEQNDALVASLPPNSLVINATGMGKDRPGSPVSDGVRFPDHSIAWDLNYRGELDFLRQARSQNPAQSVRCEDGWQYFLWGWTTIISEVFDRPITAHEMEMLAQDAAFARPVSAWGAVPGTP